MKKEIGKKLKIERVKRDLTLDDVAECLGMTASMVSQAERGLSGIKMLKRLAWLFDLELVIYESYELKQRTNEEDYLEEIDNQ